MTYPEDSLEENTAVEQDDVQTDRTHVPRSYMPSPTFIILAVAFLISGVLTIMILSNKRGGQDSTAVSPTPSTQRISVNISIPDAENWTISERGCTQSERMLWLNRYAGVSIALEDGSGSSGTPLLGEGTISDNDSCVWTFQQELNVADSYRFTIGDRHAICSASDMAETDTGLTAEVTLDQDGVHCKRAP